MPTAGRLIVPLVRLTLNRSTPFTAKCRYGDSKKTILATPLKYDAKEVVNTLANRLHLKYFSEEYDVYHDSISDARDRRRGINPMSQEYIDRMDSKRRELGVSKLSSNGTPEDDKSEELTSQWAVDLVTAHQSNLS